MNNLRGYLTEYEAGYLGRYGLLLLFVIGAIFTSNYEYNLALTCKNMSKLKEAGYPHAFHTLEEGVTDYVQNYLLQNLKIY